ncbi:MAG: hypothetical protein FD164_793 [Nitrospirae bacterium]|nr:MAG: hypothetical protein FD164_793 [Nitrospirota bacterium]
MPRLILKLAALVLCIAPVSFFLITSATGTGTALPGMITINAVQNKFGPVQFDHAKHAALAEGCGQCHHMHNDKANATCKECHALSAAHFKNSVKQQFLPCSGCHTETSATAPELPGLKVALHKKCFTCHVGMGDLGASPRGCTQICHTQKEKG